MTLPPESAPATERAPAPESAGAPRAAPDFTLNVISAWLFLAALGQLLHVAGWPVYILDRPLGELPSVVVGLVRLSVYFALGAGLVARRRDAWAGTVLELVRTFVFFCLTIQARGGELLLDAYPCSWAQGLLSGTLPLLWVAHFFMANGWRPRGAIERAIPMGVRLSAAALAVAGLWLRRQYPWFGVARAQRWKLLFLDGVPVVFILGMVELLALLLPARLR